MKSLCKPSKPKKQSHFSNMYNNAKTNELMDSCIELAEKGESIYTKEQEEEIRLIFHQSIRKGIY